MFGRRVVGKVVDVFTGFQRTPEATVVLWERQEGRVIPEHTGNAVIMLTRQLQLYKEEKK